MATLDEKHRSGIAFIEGILGAQYGAAFQRAVSADGFGSDISRMAASWAFHDAWQHQGLVRREKSIAVISALIAMRQLMELKTHVEIGIVNGLTAAELEGVLIQLAPYVGFPCITSATTVVVEAMREAGISPDGVRTAEEAGLL